MYSVVYFVSVFRMFSVILSVCHLIILNISFSIIINIISNKTFLNILLNVYNILLSVLHNAIF